jgi:hypothetical protein
MVGTSSMGLHEEFPRPATGETADLGQEVAVDAYTDGRRGPMIASSRTRASCA